MTEGGLQSAQGKKKDHLRDFLAIDEREHIVEWSQGMMGRLLIYVVAITAVATYFPWWESALVVSAAMAAAYRPNLRNPILFTATWIAAFLEIGFSENQVLTDIGVILHNEQLAGISAMVLAFGFLVAVMIGAWAMLAFVRRNPKSFLARRPLITLLAVEVLLCALPALDVMQGLPRVLLGSMLIVLTPYVWFLPYAIADQRSRDPSDPLLQMATLRPFWSPTYLPFGKGAAFLRKTLSKTPRDLAVTQLKGIKLLLWSNALLAMNTGLGWIFEDQVGVPGLAEAIDAFLLGQPFPIALAWASLILATAKYSLKIALWAGLFIGIARLAGGTDATQVPWYRRTGYPLRKIATVISGLRYGTLRLVGHLQAEAVRARAGGRLRHARLAGFRSNHASHRLRPLRRNHQ